MDDVMTVCESRHSDSSAVFGSDTLKRKIGYHSFKRFYHFSLSSLFALFIHLI